MVAPFLGGDMVDRRNCIADKGQSGIRVHSPIGGIARKFSGEIGFLKDYNFWFGVQCEEEMVESSDFLLNSPTIPLNDGGAVSWGLALCHPGDVWKGASLCYERKEEISREVGLRSWRYDPCESV